MTAGDVIRLWDGSIWFVQRSSPNSVYIVPVWSGKTKKITTRKRVTKVVAANPPPSHISADAFVEVLDPQSAYAVRVRERFMPEEKAAVAEEKAPRQNQVYVRTDKETKEMKGQGAIVMAALNELQRGTVQEITDACKGKFETRQDEARVVGFYLSKFKREGLVTVDKPAKAAGADTAADSAGSLEA